MRRALVAGNWKMHGTQAKVRELLGALLQAPAPHGVDVVVCPPFPYLGLASELLRNSRIGLGAQDLHAAAEGAFTGSVSGPMLADLGCGWVIVGHSERRGGCGEDDALVVAKARSALQAGLVPVVCIGETGEQRARGETAAVVGAQLGALLAGLSDAELGGAVLAYEPVWAIGTGLTASPDEAQDVHGLARSLLAQRAETLAAEMRILYGGSLKSGNAASLFAMPDIDGGLVGGASLEAGEFAAIWRAAEGK